MTQHLGSHVFLVGFMGSGKSKLGKQLSKRLQSSFLDMDASIEAQESMSIPSIFSARGEEAFRQLETQWLQSMPVSPAQVIALGGGTFVSEINRSIIRQLGAAVWIDIPFDILWSRLDQPEQQAKRPLLHHKNKDEVHAMYLERQAAYRLADIRWNTMDASIHEIEKEVRGYFK